MTRFSKTGLHKYYQNMAHRYRVDEQGIDCLCCPEARLLDAAGGRGLPALQERYGRAQRLIGVEPVLTFNALPSGIESCDTRRWTTGAVVRRRLRAGRPPIAARRSS
jgi:hypothetical protein